MSVINNNWRAATRVMTIDYPGSSPRQINQTSNSWSVSIHKVRCLVNPQFCIHFIHSLTNSFFLFLSLSLYLYLSAPLLSSSCILHSPALLLLPIPASSSLLRPLRPFILSAICRSRPRRTTTLLRGPYTFTTAPSSFINYSAAPAAT